MKLKLGIIGTGGIGFDKHLPEYAKLSDYVELYAASDINSGNLDRASKIYGISRLYSDYHEMLDLDELDFVVVALPNHLHAQASIDAMERGKHVHCEKPMAVSYNEAKRMFEISQRTGKTIMVGLNNRFLPQSRYVRDLVEDGYFGDIYHINTYWKRRAGLPTSPWFVDKKQSGGGCLIDIGVHMLDLAMFISGFPEPETISAATYNKFIGSRQRELFTYDNKRLPDGLPFDTEDLVDAQIKFKNGMSLSFQCSWASFTQREEAGYEIFGTKAGAKYIKRPGNQPDLMLFTIMNGRQVNIIPEFEQVIFDPLEFTEFIQCVKTGTKPKTTSAESCLVTMNVIDGIYKAANNETIIYMDGR